MFLKLRFLNSFYFFSKIYNARKQNSALLITKKIFIKLMFKKKVSILFFYGLLILHDKALIILF